jgi:osmotically-inducible protein OsmY
MRMELRQPTVAILAVMLPLSILVMAGTDRPSDDMIRCWVKSALQDDPRIAAGDIAVGVTNGIVTLKGVVGNLAEKQYALMESQKIYGVLGVVEKLHIEPQFRNEADIREDVRMRLAGSTSIQIRILGMDVQNGEVTLTGEVHSAAQREEARLLAAEVRGVRAIYNKLVVSYPRTRPDSEIQRDILDSLHRDVYLTGLPIAVSVVDGVATLSGEVGNAYERLRAEDKARVVNNVRDVNGKITVRWWEERGVRKEMPFPDAPAIQEAIYDELDLDSRIAVSNIRAETEPAGFVTLRGTVPTLQQKRIAEQDAMNVVGVRWVTNLLEVKTEPRDDYAILRDAQMAIDSDYLLSGQDIRVRVQDGVLTLTGAVSDPFRKYHAEEVALRIRGLREFVDTILVDVYPQFTDTVLRQRIRDRLAANWETRNIAAAVGVAVTKGKATLTGEVNTLAQRAEAERVAALTPGVLSVHNELTVIGEGHSGAQGHENRVVTSMIIVEAL